MNERSIHGAGVGAKAEQSASPRLVSPRLISPRLARLFSSRLVSSRLVSYRQRRVLSRRVVSRHVASCRAASRRTASGTWSHVKRKVSSVADDWGGVVLSGALLHRVSVRREQKQLRFGIEERGLRASGESGSAVDVSWRSRDTSSSARSKGVWL